MKLVQHLLSNIYYKLLLYLFPLVLFGMFIYILTAQNELDTNQKNSLPKISVKEKDIKLFDLVEAIEEEIKKNNLHIKNLKIMPKNILFQLNCNIEESLKIIDFIEKYSDKLVIKKFNFHVLSDGVVEFNYEVELLKEKNFYKKQTAKIVTNDILYRTNKITPNIINQSIEITIDAIVNEKVMINKKWHEVGSFINNKKIISVKGDYIVLENNGKKENIWIYKNEFTR
ncbi:hypothetical protein [Arcobacter sp.]|uniref:hypothetical protein n=1 Tax=Arcobacter sp. TaxID=1872629 RepID=UPI003D0A92C9